MPTSPCKYKPRRTLCCAVGDDGDATAVDEGVVFFSLDDEFDGKVSEESICLKLIGGV